GFGGGHKTGHKSRKGLPDVQGCDARVTTQTNDTKFHACDVGGPGPSCPSSAGQVAGDAFRPVRANLQLFYIFSSRSPRAARSATAGLRRDPQKTAKSQ